MTGVGPRASGRHGWGGQPPSIVQVPVVVLEAQSRGNAIDDESSWRELPLRYTPYEKPLLSSASALAGGSYRCAACRMASAVLLVAKRRAFTPRGLQLHHMASPSPLCPPLHLVEQAYQKSVSSIKSVSMIFCCLLLLHATMVR